MKKDKFEIAILTSFYIVCLRLADVSGGGISLISIITASIINRKEAKGESTAMAKALIHGMMVLRIIQRRCRSL
jgi:hypothetical protein